MSSKKTEETSHILGIDFGTVNVGLAIADTETRMAFVFAVLKNDKELWKNLADIITKENIQKIVIGVPGYLPRIAETDACRREAGHLNDGEKTKQEVFAEEVRKKFKIEVFLVEEMFTTKSAHLNLREAQKKNIGKNDDAESARIILQDWLEKTCNT